MRELGMKGAELRVVGGKNIMDLSEAELTSQAIDVLDSNGLEVISIASPLLKCTLPDAPEIDSRFQQDIFNSKHTYEDQPRLAERAFEIAKRTGAKIVRVFSYWRVVEPGCRLRARRGRPSGTLRQSRRARPDHRPRKRARLQHRHRAGNRAAFSPPSIIRTCRSSGTRPTPMSPAKSRSRPATSCSIRPASGTSTPRTARSKATSPSGPNLAQGDIDWQGQIDALAEDGYKGYVHLETHWPGPGGDKFEGSRICGMDLKRLVEATAL